MDIKTQYSNVAFGGDWSESTPVSKQVCEALDTITRAARDCGDRDPRGRELDSALDILSSLIERGPAITEALRRAFDNPDPIARTRDATVLADRARRWTGIRQV